MGVAGSGKSVQGKLLADQLALPWLSTGEFLRMLIAGKRRREMLEGKLLPDQEIITLIRKIFSVVDIFIRWFSSYGCPGGLALEPGQTRAAQDYGSHTPYRF